MMKLGIFSSHIREYAAAKGIPAAEAEAVFRALGVGCTELDMDEWNTAGLAPGDYGARLRAAGLPPVCVHGACHMCADDDGVFADALNEGKRIVESAARVGAQMALIVCGLPDDVRDTADRPRALRRVIPGLISLCDMGERVGVRVVIENFSVERLPYSRLADLKVIYKNVAKLGYALDAGNFACIGEEPLAAYDTLAARVALVHAKDWRFTDGDGFGGGRTGLRRVDGVAHGTGIVPLAALLDRLVRDEYAGALILEHNAYRFDPDDLTRSAAFLRPYCG